MSTPDYQCCDEYRRLSRRQFLATTGGAAVALGLPAWLPRVVMADDECSDRDVLVCLFLRGAADGLTLCVPHTDDLYYTARPTLAIPRPDSVGSFKAIDLDGTFGFPPQFAPLMPAYQNGDLLVIHACGSTDPTRSHFDAQRFMEIGKPGDLNLFTGWLGRHLLSVAPLVADPVLRAVGIGYGLQWSLQAGPSTLAIPELDKYYLAGNLQTRTARSDLIEAMHSPIDSTLDAAAATARQTIDLLATINFQNYVPSGGAVYPANNFAKSLKSTAALIKADVGVEAIAIDAGGWDSHVNQGVTPGGAMNNLMTSLATGLGAFYADMFTGPRKNVTVAIMSEFGRRLNQNGSIGTDHGHGGVMMLMGKSIAGGRVLTQWPGLAENQLFEGRDLAVTIDYRDILAEVVQYRLANSNLDVVFPGYTPTIRGVTRNCLRGDMNCDGVVNMDDSAPFAEALADPEGFSRAHPNCPSSGADVNADGRTDGQDLSEFIRQILP